MLAIEDMMLKWKIEIFYEHDDPLGRIRIRNGILQGDSLSPLLFTLQYDIVSKRLEKEIEGVEIDGIKHNHIVYMDDLKTMTKSSEDMEKAHDIVMETIESIGMAVNIEKSAIMRYGKTKIPENMKDVPVVDANHPYRYLGVNIADRIDNRQCMKEIVKDIDSRLERIKQRELSSFNLIREINTDIVSKIRYSSCVIEWNYGTLEEIDMKIRRMIKEIGLVPQKTLTERLYVSKDRLGLGLMNVRIEYGKELIRTLLHYRWMETNRSKTCSTRIRD